MLITILLLTVVNLTVIFIWFVNRWFLKNRSRALLNESRSLLVSRRRLYCISTSFIKELMLIVLYRWAVSLLILPTENGRVNATVDCTILTLHLLKFIFLKYVSNALSLVAFEVSLVIVDVNDFILNCLRNSIWFSFNSLKRIFVMMALIYSATAKSQLFLRFSSVQVPVILVLWHVECRYTLVKVLFSSLHHQKAIFDAIIQVIASLQGRSIVLGRTTRCASTHPARTLPAEHADGAGRDGLLEMVVAEELGGAGRLL